jgi:peptidoglycan/LPS O-acetylase OafA/YrhL
MNSSTSPHLAYLDGWRGLAIVVVLFAHFQHEYFKWAGNLGVQLFFVLSGYLMGGLLFIKEVPLRDFFARRFSRILPTFLVFVTLMAIYAATLQKKPYLVPFDEFLATLVFARTYFPADISINAGTWQIGHMWSLNVEEHSYVLLALGALIVRTLGRKNLALIFLWLSVLAALFFTLYYPTHQPDGASPWHRRSEAAALGLLASAAYRVTLSRCSLRWLAHPWPALPLLSLVVAVFCYWIFAWHGSAQPVLKYTLAPLLLAYSINHLGQAPDLVRRALSSRILCWFGTCSFSLYLWQQPFDQAYRALALPMLPMLMGALACGAVSFYCLENPLRLYLNKKWATRKQDKLPDGAELTPAGP